MTTPEFRAWDKERNEIVDVMSIDFSNKKVGVCNIPKRMFDGRLQTIYSIEKNWDEVELMQSTGLRDSKGLEIFEGDIVERMYTFPGSYGDKHIGEIVFDEEYAQYIISKPEKFTEPKTEKMRSTLSEISTYKVLGNVWENPELLEGI